MILFENINVLDSTFHSKSKNWIRPRCPNNTTDCKVYGHGHQVRFFSNVNATVFLKRWRCITCKLVLIIRPKEFWKRFQTPFKKIFSTLKDRLTYHKWPSGTPRQRGGYWLNKLKTYSLNFHEPYPDLLTLIELISCKINEHCGFI
jgi:hypothetical protein